MDNEHEFSVEVFFDGDCPLCRKEIKWFGWLDRKERIRFTDIAASDFDAETVGISFSDLMAEIHGRLPDDSMITGVEVFRHLYTAVGFRWLVLPTRLPGISHAVDWSYRVFARKRLKWTGRYTDACQVALPKKMSST